MLGAINISKELQSLPKTQSAALSLEVKFYYLDP